MGLFAAAVRRRHRPAFPAKAASRKRKAAAAKPGGSSLYVFSVGPIPTESGSGSIYVGVLDGRVFSPPDVAGAASALRALRDRAPAGTTLGCSPELARAGARLGFVGAPPPRSVLELRAELAVSLAHGPLAPRAQNELLPLIDAAASFWGSRIWARLPAGVALEAKFEGAVDGVYEAAVMGSRGEEFGVVLYPRAGSMAELARAMAAGRLDRARQIDSFGVSLDEEPSFAAKAVGAWSGLGRVPTAFALRGGAAAAIEASEAVALALTLRAASRLAGTPGEVIGLSLTVDDRETTLTLRVPDAAAPARGPKVRKKR